MGKQSRRLIAGGHLAIPVFTCHTIGYRITCVDLDHPGTGEIVGNLDDSGMSAIIHLYIVRDNGNRFRPLHKKKKFGRLD